MAWIEKSFSSIQIIEVDRASSAKVDKQLWAVEAKRGGYVENSFNKSYSVLSKEVIIFINIYQELTELEPFFPLRGISDHPVCSCLYRVFT